MYFLDCKGQECPLPVLETKKALEEASPEAIEVAVDNETSRENVERFLLSKGYDVTVEERDGETIIVAHKKNEANTVRAAVQKRIVVFIDGETLGRGDDQLGAVLMKSFVHTIKELQSLPWRIILINGGVKLATVGSPVLPQLQELDNAGVEIISCGTCLDFYGIKEKLNTGRVSNMFEIVSSLTEATHVLKP